MEKVILIVDDKIEHLIIYSTFLNEMSCKIICVGSGKEALRVLKTEKIDLIIVDIQMPGMSGADLIKFIRHPLAKNKFKCEHETVPIISLSSGCPCLHKCSLREVSVCLCIPLTKEELVKSVKKIFEIE